MRVEAGGAETGLSETNDGELERGKRLGGTDCTTTFRVSEVHAKAGYSSQMEIPDGTSRDQQQRVIECYGEVTVASSEMSI